ncbi:MULTISPECIES: IS66 family insertion sequence element accessory protein TnpA [Alcaligenaceae]|nr:MULTISPECIES: transposase [Alcaligenaceae]
MEFWSSHLSAIDAEGVTAKDYARQHGLSVSSLYYWRKQLKHAAGANGAAGTSTFLPVQVAVDRSPGSSASCTLVLAPGVRLELAQLPSAEWLAALGRALQGAR